MTETIAGSLLFLRLESAAGRKRRGPGKPALQSIPTPLVRCLVALVAPSAVLRASAEIVGRRASLFHTLLLACCDYEEEWAIRVTAPSVAHPSGGAARAASRPTIGQQRRQRAHEVCLWPVAPAVRDQCRV